MIASIGKLPSGPNRPAKIVQRIARTLACSTLACTLFAGNSSAQTSGNTAYGQNGAKARAEQNQRNLHTLTPQDLPPDKTSMFIEANVLMNIKADEYVAVFAVSQEGASVQEASDKMTAVVGQFTQALNALHIQESAIYVDFITQPKIYGYDVAKNVAKEKLEGFQVNKNVSIHYTDRGLLDSLILAAAKAQIYDLVKVDYVVKDISAVQDKLMGEAAAVVKQKLARDKKLLGITAQTPAEIYAERPAIYYPTDMYDSYTAAEAESVSRPNLQNLTVQQARKGRTFFFNALDGNGFDKVINPVILEPVVQFTLYLKVKYQVAH